MISCFCDGRTYACSNHVVDWTSSRNLKFIVGYRKWHVEPQKIPLFPFAKRNRAISSSTCDSTDSRLSKPCFAFGKMRSNNGGNRSLRRLVKKKPRYDAGFKAAKTEMTGTVVTTVQQDGGRFLKKEDYDRWIKVSDNEACEKVAHMFRNARRASNPGSSNSH
jgi:hypothetical protein